MEMMTTPTTVTATITKDTVLEATGRLQEYKAGKSALETRLVDNDKWWRLRHWQRGGAPDEHKSKSAWLFNTIMGKHADAIEAFPTVNVLPREESDKPEAGKLSSILPVVLDHAEFEQVYSDAMWDKLKSGTAAYGVFWDSSKLNGLGDVAIRTVSLLNLFWEPGVARLEDSQEVFCVQLRKNKELETEYPELAGNLRGYGGLKPTEYYHDDGRNTSDMSLVVDWYYKRKTGGKTLLHYCKYVNDVILYASENEPELADRGFYDDGEFPFVLDVLFPVPDSPCGIGYVDIGRSTQDDIDRMNTAAVNYALMSARPRYFTRTDGAINEDELGDWTKPLVHTNGNLGQDSIRQMELSPMPGYVMNMIQAKIEELKYTSANMDVSNGSTGGVTAATAIAALQEAAGRTSKDSTKATYRAYKKIVLKVIERIRQFYDIPRQFRILGSMGMEQFVQYNNEGLAPVQQAPVGGVDMGMRLPVFDLDIIPEKKTAYTRMAQNELALQFYNLGFFRPDLTDQALATLEMMDFDGKTDVEQRIALNGTMAQQLALYQQMALSLAMKYEPEMAEGLAAQITQGTGMTQTPMAAGSMMDTGLTDTGEGSRMARARQNSQEATQPS